MTHKERTLEYIRRFGSISSMEAFRDLGNTRLSATIYSLRKDGYKILSTKEQSKNRFGEKTTYDRYYLEGIEKKGSTFKVGDRVKVKDSIYLIGKIINIVNPKIALVKFDDDYFETYYYALDALELYTEETTSDYIHYHEMQVDDIKKSKDDDGKNLSAAYLNWCKSRNDSSDSKKRRNK